MPPASDPHVTPEGERVPLRIKAAFGLPSIAGAAIALSSCKTGAADDSRCLWSRDGAKLGYSGAAQAGPGRYLEVHDTKAHKDGRRIGLLEIEAGNPVCYQDVSVADWKHPQGRSSDLEAACALYYREGCARAGVDAVAADVPHLGVPEVGRVGLVEHEAQGEGVGRRIERREARRVGRTIGRAAVGRPQADGILEVL